MEGGGGCMLGGGCVIILLVFEAAGRAGLLELNTSCNVGGGAAACMVDNIREVWLKSECPADVRFSMGGGSLKDPVLFEGLRGGNPPEDGAETRPVDQSYPPVPLPPPMLLVA